MGKATSSVYCSWPWPSICHTRYGNRPPLVLIACRGKALRYQQRVGEEAEVPLPAEGQKRLLVSPGEGPRLGQ